MLKNHSSSRRLRLNRDYMLLWSGQLVSATGSQVSLVVFPLLILALTHSPAQAGFVGALGSLTYLLLSLPAGALVDRWDRKRVMLICDTCRCLNMASVAVVPLVWRLTVVQLALVSVVEGALFVFFSAAEAAALPRVVPREQLSAAAAQNLAADRVSILLGPPLGGFLYSTAGRLIPFLADAVSYSASVLSLLFIATQFQQERQGAVCGCRLWSEMLEGVTWLWRRPLLRFLVLSGGGVNLSFGGASLITIVLARHLHASPPAIGMLFAAGGIGGLLGSFLVGGAQRRFGIGEITIGVHWLWTLLWVLYVVAPNPVVVGALAAGLYVLATVRTATLYSYRLSLIPDELQGRINSVARLISLGGQPLSLALTGVLLQSIGVYPTILAVAVCLLTLAMVVTLHRGLRHAPPLAEITGEVH